MGTKPTPPPLHTGMVQQLFKVNNINFSNPKRILKPLLICLPFCFVCSAQVKGNLTFGILTANNPHQGQGREHCSVSMWLTRMVGTFQLSAEGPRRHTVQGREEEGKRDPRELSVAPRAGLYLLHWVSPRPGERRDALLDEGTQAVQVESPSPKQPPYTGLPQVKYSASRHFHFATVTESTAGPDSAVLQQPLHVQATPQSAGHLGRVTCSTLSHTPEAQCTGKAGPRARGSCPKSCCVNPLWTALLTGSGTGSAQWPREARTSRAGFVWRRLTSSLRPLKQQGLG